MRSICLLFGILFIYACSAKNPDERNIRYVEVPKGHAYVQSQDIESDLVKVLQYTGVEALEDIDIKLHTDNSHYIYFAAVVDYPTDENGGYSSLDGQLKAIKQFNGCFFYDLTKDQSTKDFVIEQLSIDLMIDKKISSVLGNDSLYLSINGFDYQTMPEPMRISSRRLNEFNGKFYNLNSVVPLMSANVRLPENKDKNIESKMLLGLISYDCSQKYDFNGFYNSPQFAYAVGFPDILSAQQTPTHLELDINDFIKIEE